MLPTTANAWLLTKMASVVAFFTSNEVRVRCQRAGRQYTVADEMASVVAFFLLDQIASRVRDGRRIVANWLRSAHLVEAFARRPPQIGFVRRISLRASPDGLPKLASFGTTG